LKLKKKIIVLDFNPEIIKELMEKKIPCIYGDLGDIDVLKRLDFKDAKIVVSTVPDRHDNLLLLNRLKDVNSKAITFTTAVSVDDALELYEHGSDYVILPHFLGGEHAAFLINDLTGDITKVIKHRTKHIKELRHRKLIGHDYPPGLYMR
jgi:voltage-gated potassium channel Kch